MGASYREQMAAQRDIEFQWHSLDAAVAHRAMKDAPFYRPDLWLLFRRMRADALSKAWVALQRYALSGGTKYE